MIANISGKLFVEYAKQEILNNHYKTVNSKRLKHEKHRK